MPFVSPSELPCNLGVSAAFDQAGLLCLIRPEIFQVMVAQQVLPNHADGKPFRRLPNRVCIQTRVGRNCRRRKPSNKIGRGIPLPVFAELNMRAQLSLLARKTSLSACDRRSILAARVLVQM